MCFACPDSAKSCGICGYQSGSPAERGPYPGVGACYHLSPHSRFLERGVRGVSPHGGEEAFSGQKMREVARGATRRSSTGSRVGRTVDSGRFDGIRGRGGGGRVRAARRAWRRRGFGVIRGRRRRKASWWNSVEEHSTRTLIPHLRPHRVCLGALATD